MKPIRHAQQITLVFGIFIALTGLTANEWVLTHVFSADHNIRVPRTKIIIWIFDLILICIGAGFIIFRRNQRVAGFGVNCLLFLASSGIVITTLELVFPIAYQSIPIEIRSRIPWPHNVLSQSTKQSRVPQNYIAIFGDSYAEGVGDWFSETGKSSADVLADKLNLDVITFGKGGASSITGIVLNPLIALRVLNYRADIEDPQTILIYFYEGNDLDNTLVDHLLRQPSYQEFSGTTTLKKETYYNYLDHLLTSYEGKINKSILYWREVLSSYLIVSRILFEATREGIMELPALFSKLQNKNATNSSGQISLVKKVAAVSKETPDFNMAYLGDKVVHLHDTMQGPALQLSEAERQLTLKIFEYCVGYIKERFLNSRIAIVYVPSPLSSYRLASATRAENWMHLIGADSQDWVWPEFLANNRDYFQNRPSSFSKDQVYESSNFIADEIHRIAKTLDVGFVDPREEMRTASEKLHGPKDLRHFNRKGYEILASAIIRHYQNLLESK